MRLLVTRPQPDADRFADALREIGVRPVLAPLLEIYPSRAALPDLAGFTALAASSAAAIRRFAATTNRRDLPLFTVGTASASEAREMGFAQVVSGGGDARALATTLRSRLRREHHVLYLRGEVVARDLAELMGPLGPVITSWVGYAMRPVARLPEAALEALTTGGLDGVTLMSARTAATFRALIAAEQPGIPMDRLRAYCLSHGVAEAVADMGWLALRVSPSPATADLLAVIARDRPTGAPHV